MTDQDNISEEEALERELWEQDGSYFTLEEMPYEMLGVAIFNVQNNDGWRKDWLPALLCEKERRDELMEQEEQKAEQEQSDVLDVNSMMDSSQASQTMLRERARLLLERELMEKSSQRLPPEVQYRPSSDSYVLVVSMSRLKELFNLAASLSEKGPSPQLPEGKLLEIQIEDDCTQRDIEEFNRASEIIGKLRLLKAIFGEGVKPDPKARLRGLYQQQWRGAFEGTFDGARSAMDDFAKAVTKAYPDKEDKPHQKIQSYKKFERGRYRK